MAVDWSKIRVEAIPDISEVIAELPPTFQLPALPHAVTQFVQKSRDPSVPIRELSKLIESETALTLEVLRVVNSARVGLRNPCSTVQHAIAVLGMKQVKSLVITSGTKAAVLSLESKLINQTGFWNAALQKALFAQEVANLLGADADLAFAGAMLQDYLLPAVTNERCDDYVNFISSRSDHPACICEFENETFGFDHATAGACLAVKWYLPDDLVCCILFHHHGVKLLEHPELKRSAAAAVAVAALLPDQLQQQSDGFEQLLELQDNWPEFDLEQLAATVDERHAEFGIGIRNEFPLSQRCRVSTTAVVRFQNGILHSGVESRSEPADSVLSLGS